MCRLLPNTILVASEAITASKEPQGMEINDLYSLQKYHMFPLKGAHKRTYRIRSNLQTE